MGASVCATISCSDLELALARGEAGAFGGDVLQNFAVLVELGLVELRPHGEVECKPFGGRPVIGAVLDLGLQGREEGRFSRAVAAAHIDAPGRLGIDEAQRLLDGMGDLGVIARPQQQPVELDALVEMGIGGGVHVVNDVADAGPHRDHVVPAGRQFVHVVGHLDLPRQGGGERHQGRGIAGVLRRHIGHGGEHHGEADDAAGRAKSLAGHDGGNLGPQAVAYPGLEPGDPQAEIEQLPANTLSQAV